MRKVVGLLGFLACIIGIGFICGANDTTEATIQALLLGLPFFAISGVLLHYVVSEIKEAE